MSPQPPLRLSLGRRKATGPESSRLCSPNTGQASDGHGEGSDHDYLPLVRTREVEGGVARAMALSQLTSPPTSSLLRCGCRRRLAPSAWTPPSAQRCTSPRSACAGPHPSLRTAPASAPPQPHLPGHSWALVSARATVPRLPAAHPPAQAQRVQARWTVGRVQTQRPQKVQEGRVVPTFGAGPGPQQWHLRGWSTAVPLLSANGNWQQLRLTVGFGHSTCRMALTWPPSRLQPEVSSCCYATGTRTCSYICCVTAQQTCEGCPLLGLVPPNRLKSLPPGLASPCWEGVDGWQPAPNCFSSSQDPLAPTESACLCSLPLLPPVPPTLPL